MILPSHCERTKRAREQCFHHCVYYCCNTGTGCDVGEESFLSIVEGRHFKRVQTRNYYFSTKTQEKSNNQTKSSGEIKTLASLQGKENDRLRELMKAIGSIQLLTVLRALKEQKIEQLKRGQEQSSPINPFPPLIYFSQ